MFGGELRGSAAFSADRSCCGHPVPGVRYDQLTLKFREDREHREHRLPVGGGGVDSLFENSHPDPSLMQLGAEGDQMQNRPADPVESGDHQRVTTAHALRNRIPLWPGCLRAAGVIEMNVVDIDARPRQRVDLVGGILICAGDSCVAEQHPSTIPRRLVNGHCFATPVSARARWMDVDVRKCRKTSSVSATSTHLTDLTGPRLGHLTVPCGRYGFGFRGAPWLPIPGFLTAVPPYPNCPTPQATAIEKTNTPKAHLP